MTHPPRPSRCSSCFLAFGVSALAALSSAQNRARPLGTPVGAPRGEPDAGKVGLIFHRPTASPGYTLLAPLNTTLTCLIDLEGKVVHTWPSKYEPGQAVHLLDDGSILRCGRLPANQHFGGGGIGGCIERIAPDGQRLWEFLLADENHCQHHDVHPLPNGHVLLIAWEKKTRAEAINAGRDPEQLWGKELWPDFVVEVAPQGATGGTIVWEWHVWDHLVQDFDAEKPNYGAVGEHPELIDLSYRRTTPRETPAEIARLRSLGYVGGARIEEEEPGPPPSAPGPGAPGPAADWCHTNSIDYDAKLDQILLSVYTFNEIWIIDHSTTSKEAASHRGGRSGKGGDLLYRWGNPRAYAAGSAKDQMLFAQHDARWIPEGLPGAGHLTVFNNGVGRPDGEYSSVMEIAPPVDSDGRYRLVPGKAFEPTKPCWEYAAPNRSDFFARHMSGAERLPGGNTLICAGEDGRVIEVDPTGNWVWEYICPYGRRPVPGGPPGPRPAPPPPGGAGGGLFRATRLRADYPGVLRVLQAESAPQQ
jgi:hypothetical protein